MGKGTEQSNDPQSKLLSAISQRLIFHDMTFPPPPSALPLFLPYSTGSMVLHIEPLLASRWSLP